MRISVKTIVIGLFFLMMINAKKINAQVKNPLTDVLNSNPQLFSEVLNHHQKKEIQILYTQINRDKNNKASFKTYSYNLNNQHYFYPASTIKLPAAIFALEKLNEFNINGLNKDNRLAIRKDFGKQTEVLKDSSSSNGFPSIANYIKKILLVSDNDAFNRIYEFVGRAEINQKLKKYGFSQSRIINRLSIGDKGENAKHTNPFDFYDEKGKILYQQKGAYDQNEYPLKLTNLKRGKGYYNSNDSLINEPFDFSNMNVFQLKDQHELMKKLFFPENYSSKNKFNLTPSDYDFLYSYMSKYPNESTYPKYSLPDYYPAYCKFLFYGAGDKKPIDANIRIFNKVGDAYGYTIDNMYFIDYKNQVEFILTAVIQSNTDEIYNDNKYEYNLVCYPFLKNLGEKIYELEIARPKKNKPNLDKYLKYK
jgi:hypothetical protein